MVGDDDVGASGLIERRWQRYGHDRVYLESPDGTKVGYIDLKQSTLEVQDPSHGAAAQAAFDRWCKAGDDVVPRPEPEPQREKEQRTGPQSEPVVASAPRPSSKQSTRPRKADDLPKLITAKRDSTCTVCASTVPKGAELFWVPNSNVVVCPPCTAGEVAAGLETGRAGASAKRVADGAARKHAERLLAAYPMLGEHLVANARPTSNMHAWMRGADGERIVGRKLDIAAESGQLIVLHDRRMPSGGNIDHLVIGPRRICVIDAKHYRNKRISKSDDQLLIDGKPAEHLIDGIRHQRATVVDALSDRPRVADNVFAVLAFVEGKFGPSESVVHRGVWCSTVKEAVAYAAWRFRTIGTATLKMDEHQRREIADVLARAFPPC